MSGAPLPFLGRQAEGSDGRASIEGVTFDLDGVIVSTDERHDAAWKEIADEVRERSHIGPGRGEAAGPLVERRRKVRQSPAPATGGRRRTEVERGMFDRFLGNKKKLEQQLAHEGGSVAWATITDVGTDLATGSVDGFNQTTSRTDHMKVTLTVQPERGEPFEASFRQAFSGLSPRKGWQCRVIYDPNDRSRIAVVEDSITPPGVDHARAERAAELRSEAVAAASSGHMAEYVESLKARVESGELHGVTIVDGQTTSSGAPASRLDIVDQLTKLDALRVRGVLTDAEFATQKARLLAEH
jgi:beta-phosphoglucomutase-like phosphatase (HAD superfamily)